jgi:alkylation response protein AidB-like acyl-CoA dehydrogenase
MARRRRDCRPPAAAGHGVTVSVVSDRAGLFDTEHEDFRASFRTFLERDVVPHDAAWKQAGAVPGEVFRVAAEHGFVAMAVPERHGGLGVEDFRFNVVIGEEIARAGVVGFGAGLTLHNDVCVPLLMQAATEAQADRWLPGIAAGVSLCALAVAEPNLGSDLGPLTTTARPSGDGYVINGIKSFVSNGATADLVIVAAQTGAAEPADDAGVTLLVVERQRVDGCRSRPLRLIGRESQAITELTFLRTHVDAACRLGEEGSAADLLADAAPQELLSIAVGALASARATLEFTTTYVKERKAFGAPIARFQNTQFEIAELTTAMTVAQAHVDHCLRQHLAGRLSTSAAAMAKLWCSELQSDLVDRCLQLHGGYGYMREYPIAQAFLDARATRLYGASSEALKQTIAASLGL